MVALSQFLEPEPKPIQPTQSVEEEIELMREEFVALGITDPHAAVVAWLGKPSNFSGRTMHTPQEVLDFFRAQLQATIPQPAEHPQDAVDHTVAQQRAANVVNDGKTADNVSRIHQANAAWRKAVSDRKAAMMQWDIYVAQLRQQYQDAKNGA
jgi:hypothetical protein